MPFVNCDGARIYWRVDGRAEAPPLVMVGSLGSDHAMWNPVMGALARHFRVIRIDKRGHGASDAPPGDYTMERLGRDVLAVADAAGAPRFRYMGLSIGGMIGMWIAGNAPERIERLVLTNTTARVDPSTFAERIATIRSGGLAAVADMVLGRFFTPAYAARNTVHYATVRQTLLSLEPEGYIGCCTAIRDMAIEPLLARIVAPTLVVAGTFDPSTTPEQGRWIAQQIPGARYFELPTAHFSPSEQPGRFADAVVRFLLGTDAAAGRIHEQQRHEIGLARQRQAMGGQRTDASAAQPAWFGEGLRDMQTRYAWGEVWSSPVLDDRTRRLLAIAQCVALGQWDAFREQVRAGLAAGLDPGELDALLTLSAIQCGTPAANAALANAAELLREHEAATRPG